MADVGFLGDHRYLIHDRDGKYCPAFDDTITEGGVTPVRLPPRSPNLKGYASHCTSLDGCDVDRCSRSQRLSPFHA